MLIDKEAAYDRYCSAERDIVTLIMQKVWGRAVPIRRDRLSSIDTVNSSALLSRMRSNIWKYQMLLTVSSEEVVPDTWQPGTVLVGFPYRRPTSPIYDPVRWLMSDFHGPQSKYALTSIRVSSRHSALDLAFLPRDQRSQNVNLVETSRRFHQPAFGGAYIRTHQCKEDQANYQVTKAKS